jgi:hypothetical protein
MQNNFRNLFTAILFSKMQMWHKERVQAMMLEKNDILASSEWNKLGLNVTSEMLL